MCYWYNIIPILLQRGIKKKLSNFAELPFHDCANSMASAWTEGRTKGAADSQGSLVIFSLLRLLAPTLFGFHWLILSFERIQYLWKTGCCNMSEQSYLWWHTVSQEIPRGLRCRSNIRRGKGTSAIVSWFITAGCIPFSSTFRTNLSPIPTIEYNNIIIKMPVLFPWNTATRSQSNSVYLILGRSYFSCQIYINSFYQRYCCYSWSKKQTQQQWNPLWAL